VSETSADFSIRVPIAKVDEDARLVFGVALTATDASGQEVTDHQGDVISPEDMALASYEYVQSSRDAGIMHEGPGGIGALICSVPLTPEIRKSAGLEPGPAVWFVGYRITDDAAWQRIKSGELAEFSIGGTSLREPLP
jgi:hypothetical protein